MRLRIGTFNLNNLFSRYNFEAEISAVENGETEIATLESFIFVEPLTFKVRRHLGRLVRGKNPADTLTVAERIRTLDLDVLAVQEVEDIDTLRRFCNELLPGRYPYQVLIEGNDPRLIDLGLLSKYPLGAVTSHQHARHPDEPFRPIFGRDLLEVQILSASGRRKLLTVFNNHLKSHFVRWNEDPVEGQRANDRRRHRQAETVARIVEARTRPDSRYLVLGDMNDPPDSDALAPLRSPALGLVDGLAAPQETHPPIAERPPSATPADPAWTHRFKASGQPARHELFDQIWLSPALAARQRGAFIDRRRRSVAGDGSDHDPAWVELEL